MPDSAAPPSADATSSFYRNHLSHRAGFLIRRLHQIHLSLFAEECADFGVTPVQYSILTVAAVHPDIDQASLGHEVGVDRATLANVIARLKAHGLISRSKKATDRRVNLIRVTARGSAVLAQMDGAAQRAHERTVAALPENERALFISYLSYLVEAGNEHGRAPLRIG
ncbi:winged helix-turn-helix transcriptional regulator [Komagataeibacter sp. FXV3]|nr:winged helix-turn-helix transcriptional regulator [Komagataeibacter sp. FXV3]